MLEGEQEMERAGKSCNFNLLKGGGRKASLGYMTPFPELPLTKGLGSLKKKKSPGEEISVVSGMALSLNPGQMLPAKADLQ